jgi:hypothetical protein
LDPNNTGHITKEAFIDWKLSQSIDRKGEEFKELAKQIFQMFDEDGSG